MDFKERDDGKAVSTVSIRMKARVCYCTRNGRSTVGQKLPDDWEKQLDDFLTFCKQIIVENNFTEDLIFNIWTKFHYHLIFHQPDRRRSRSKIIRRQNCRGLYAAADYTMFFFYSKKRALRIIRRCGLYTGKYEPSGSRASGNRFIIPRLTFSSSQLKELPLIQQHRSFHSQRFELYESGVDVSNPTATAKRCITQNLSLRRHCL
ncbi:hypothetical protein TNCV_5064641 [Trichonephila clavipes]|nr:hypothetical protein TNCV_5064641 [Trichonephila clavipes]